MIHALLLQQADAVDELRRLAVSAKFFESARPGYAQVVFVIINFRKPLAIQDNCGRRLRPCHYTSEQQSGAFDSVFLLLPLTAQLKIPDIVLSRWKHPFTVVRADFRTALDEIAPHDEINGMTRMASMAFRFTDTSNVTNIAEKCNYRYAFSNFQSLTTDLFDNQCGK